jgi:2-hydroxy-3-oxopropionate reductase
MAHNLIKGGHTVIAYDIVPALLDAAIDNGAARGESCREVASRSEVVITMLPDGPDVEKAMLGPGGVLDGAAAGTVVIDMSSISPLVSQKVAAACEAKGVEFLDAPVSGGEPKAIDATLAIMCGGKDELFNRMTPLLRLMGATVTLTGPVGAGNVTKLANQIMVACNIAAMGEALLLASKCGLDPEVVFQAVKGGLAGSTVLNAKAPMVIGRNFKPGFRIRLHEKDLRNALLAADSANVPLPLTSKVQEMLVALRESGRGDYDHSGIVTWLEDQAGAKIEKKS